MTILIPTDFSEDARNAALYAISMFNDEKCQFLLLNSYGIPRKSASMFISLERAMLQESKDYLENEVNALKKYSGNENLKIKTFSESVLLLPAVTKIIDNFHVNVVVMGTAGASGIEEMIMGSNTYDVIREVSCPVLAVPKNAKFEKMNDVVFTADFEKINESLSLSFLNSILLKNDASLTILNVVSSENETDFENEIERIKLDKEFSAANHRFEVMINDDISQGIEEYCKSKKPDMVVMMAREMGFFESVFHKSVTRKVNLHTQVPVLTLHDKK